MTQHSAKVAALVLAAAIVLATAACSADEQQPGAASPTAGTAVTDRTAATPTTPTATTTTATTATSTSDSRFASETSLRFSYPPGAPTELTEMSWDPITSVSSEETTSQPTEAEPVPQTESVTARIAAFDPATGALSYVNQYLIDPPDTQGYLADDPNDSSEHKAFLSPNADIRFVYSSCTNGGGSLVPSGVACTAQELASAIATPFVASLVLIDDTVVALRQIYQA